MVTNLVTILDPLAATTTPDDHPAQAAALWTVMAFARRDFEIAFAQRSSLTANTNPVATEMFDDTTTITGPPLGATADTPSQRPAAREFADAAAALLPQPDTADAQWDILDTGQPSLLHDIVAFGASLLDAGISRSSAVYSQ